MVTPIGRLISVVFECADLRAESQFWQGVLGYVPHHVSPNWVTLVDPSNPSARLSFQRVDDHTEPTWPERIRPQQAHFDVLVDNLEQADERAVALGARRLTSDVVVHEEESFRVYADPAGHPFCLIVQVEPDL